MNFEAMDGSFLRVWGVARDDSPGPFAHTVSLWRVAPGTLHKRARYCNGSSACWFS
ncbi:hypothetical protein YTPLAS18_32250 [Nitrospira sp.]|nr:hypothetical protein YTPLAS18_32250 [Nitrospira sp.]